MPILFLIIGYGTIYILLSPVVDLVSSSVRLILLDTKPTFNKADNSIFDENKELKDNNKTLSQNDIKYPTLGVEYGQVIVDKAKIKAKLYFGDSPEDLRRGVGQYNGSVFPGEEGTSLIGGHNTTDFGTLNVVETNDPIVIKTNYGTYTYKVTSKRVAKFDDPTAIESINVRNKGRHLILYTCYPIEMIGLTDDRLFVYADLVSGPLIEPNK